jgi:hypothetical protein
MVQQIWDELINNQNNELDLRLLQYQSLLISSFGI